MYRNTLLCLALVSLMLVAAHGLKMSHKPAQEPMTAEFLSHRMYNLAHLDEEEKAQDKYVPTGNQAFDDFMEFLFTDSTIASVPQDATELPQAAVDKIDEYLLAHTEVIDLMITRPQDSDFFTCVHSLNDEQKNIFYKLVLDEMDVNDQNGMLVSEEKIKKIIEEAKDDSNIGAQFTCA